MTDKGSDECKKSSRVKIKQFESEGKCECANWRSVEIIVQGPQGAIQRLQVALELEASCGHLKVPCGHMKVPYGHQEAQSGNLKALCGSPVTCGYLKVPNGYPKAQSSHHEAPNDFLEALFYNSKT